MRPQGLVEHFTNAKAATLSVAVLFLLFLSVGCATYQKDVSEARELIRSRSYNSAVQRLQPLAEKQSDDQLVYLFDYATALQLSGQFAESNRIFAMADQLSEVQDYHSLSRVTGSLLLNEGMVQYKGDDYEKVLINAFKAINYLMLNDLDAALVETRRLNEKLYKYKFEGKKNYEQNVFAIYLSGIIWEADRKWDDAFISYSKAYELNPNIPLLKEDLLRLSKLAQRPEEFERFQRMYPEVKLDPNYKSKEYGEIVVIFQQGWGPRKRPRPEAPRFPKLYGVGSTTQRAQVQLEPLTSSQGPLAPLSTVPVYSVEDVAIKTLEDDYASLVAKRMAGVATKYVVAEQLRQKNEALGAIAWIGMNLADQADLRQWSTLPETFQIARLRVPAGKYRVLVSGADSAGGPTGEVMDPVEVEVKPMRKVFLSWRSVL